MLHPEFQLFDRAVQQWMGTAQISICIMFLVVYFSILSLHQLIELRQNAKSNDHGFIDHFIVYTAAEWKNEPDRAGFFESDSAQISGGIWGVYFVFLYLLFCYCQRYEQMLHISFC